MIKTITDIIAIITVSQLLLFALFLLWGKADRGFDKTALALFLSANGFFILNFLAFRYSKEIIPYTVNLFLSAAPLVFFLDLFFICTQTL